MTAEFAQIVGLGSRVSSLGFELDPSMNSGSTLSSAEWVETRDPGLETLGSRPLRLKCKFLSTLRKLSVIDYE